MSSSEPAAASSSSGSAATADSQQSNRAKCISRLEHAVTTNKRVQSMIEAIEGLGCAIPDNFFSCGTCDRQISGGFIPRQTPNCSDSGTAKGGKSAVGTYVPKLMMCDNPMDDTTFENTMVHELVHAYDQCKVKLDFANCLHHACTEVRASNLSGECSYRQEFNRGNRQVHQGGLLCVQRRATLSVANNPYCKDVAKDAVLAVYDFCSHDAAPLEDAKYED